MNLKYSRSYVIKEKRHININVKKYLICMNFLVLSIFLGFGLSWLICSCKQFALAKTEVVAGGFSTLQDKVKKEFLSFCKERYNTTSPNVFLIEFDDFKKKILSKFKEIKDIHFKIKIPNKLLITVKGRQAIGLLLENGELFAFDKEGVFLNYPISKLNLLILTGIKKTQKDRLKQAIKLIEAIPQKENISEINFQDPNDIKIFLMGGELIKIGNMDNLREKMERLYYLINSKVAFKEANLKFPQIIIKIPQENV